MIEAWRVFPALTGVERTAFQAVNWGGTAEVIRSLVRDLDGLFFCLQNGIVNTVYGLWDRRVSWKDSGLLWLPDSRQYVTDHKKKEIYHGKRKEISTGHHIYG